MGFGFGLRVGDWVEGFCKVWFEKVFLVLWIEEDFY